MKQVAVFVLGLLFVAASGAAVRADVADDAQAHSKAFERAMNARDVAAARALYADDARVIFPGQGEEATGKTAVERLLRDVFAAFEGATTTLVSQNAIPLSDGLIGVVGHWRITFRDPDGGSQTVDVR